MWAALRRAVIQKVEHGVADFLTVARRRVDRHYSSAEHGTDSSGHQKSLRKQQDFCFCPLFSFDPALEADKHFFLRAFVLLCKLIQALGDFVVLIEHEPVRDTKLKTFKVLIVKAGHLD